MPETLLSESMLRRCVARKLARFCILTILRYSQTISDLHLYRGLEPCATGHIMGHEFAGTVVQVGDAVKQVKVGDEIVSPFTISWSVALVEFRRFMAKYE